MSQITRDRIAQRLEETGKTATAVSRAIGRTPGFVRDFLVGRKATLNADALARIATELDTSVDFLAGESARGIRQPRRSLPVMGLAAGSLTGADKWTGDIIETLPMPPAIAGVRDAYALYVTGESMIPALRPRDLLVVNPHHPARAGDIVVVQEERDGTHYAWVKEFQRFREDTLVCRQYNPAAEVTFKRRYIIGVHRVLTTAELVGL